MDKRIVQVTRKLGSYLNDAEFLLECGHSMTADGFWSIDAEYLDCSKEHDEEGQKI